MQSRQASTAAEKAFISPFSAPWRLGGSFVLIGALALSGCRKSDAALAGLAPPPVLDHSVKPDSVRAQDELFVLASQRDPFDLARLADREGASGLLEALEEGGVVGLTALSALAHADDAEIAFRRLGELLRLLDSEKTAPVVEAALAIAQKPPRQAEVIDGAAAKYCADALLDLAKKKSAPAPIRADAISALRRLKERGLVDPTEIPTDLDPS